MAGSHTSITITAVAGELGLRPAHGAASIAVKTERDCHTYLWNRERPCCRSPSADGNVFALDSTERPLAPRVSDSNERWNSKMAPNPSGSTISRGDFTSRSNPRWPPKPVAYALQTTLDSLKPEADQHLVIESLPAEEADADIKVWARSDRSARRGQSTSWPCCLAKWHGTHENLTTLCYRSSRGPTVFHGADGSTHEQR